MVNQLTVSPWSQDTDTLSKLPHGVVRVYDGKPTHCVSACYDEPPPLWKHYSITRLQLYKIYITTEFQTSCVHYTRWHIMLEASWYFTFNSVHKVNLNLHFTPRFLVLHLPFLHFLVSQLKSCIFQEIRSLYILIYSSLTRIIVYT